VGEVGLGGEVRSVAGIERRLAEAARIGFLQAIVPASAPDVAGIDLVRVSDLPDALGAALSVFAES
jgi:DNA repair protein RadA/Sms